MKTNKVKQETKKNAANTGATIGPGATAAQAETANTATQPTAKKVIALYRVSTESQDLERQKIELYRALQFDGYTAEQIADVDNKESGVLLSMDEREGIQKMKKYIEGGGIEAVYVHELSRLSRRAADTFAIRDYLQAHRVQLVV